MGHETENSGVSQRTPQLLTALLFIAGSLLRYRYVDFGLPYLFNTDESTNLQVIHAMIARGSFNPEFFNYPSLMFYANLPGQFLVMLLDGELRPPDIQTIGSSFTSQPASVLAARLTSLAFGIGVMALAMRWARVLGAGCIGMLLALVFVALNPLLIRQSAWHSPDMISGFLTTGALMASTAIVTRGGAWTYVAAGLLAGLAAATKYNCGSVVVAIAAAHFLREGLGVSGVRRLFLAALMTLLGFAAATPWFFLDLPSALGGLIAEIRHYSAGHPGASGDALRVYAEWLAQIVSFGALGAAGLLIPGRLRPAAPALVFILVYFAMISMQNVRFERNLTPILPAILVMIAVGFDRIAQQFRGARSAAVLATAAALYAAPIYGTARQALDYDRDPQRAARDWLESHLPPGVDVIVDSYTPYLDPATRQVDGAAFLLAQDFADIVGHDYAVFSRDGSGRLLDGGYPDAEQRLSELQAAACAEWRFPDGAAEPDHILFMLDCR